jgi:hypothetical protein
MPLLRRRPLTRAAMVGGAGYAIGKRREASSVPVSDAASEANRIDALTKLKSLLDMGVLTQEQYDSEHARLTKGI